MIKMLKENLCSCMCKAVYTIKATNLSFLGEINLKVNFAKVRLGLGEFNHKKGFSHYLSLKCMRLYVSIYM